MIEGSGILKTLVELTEEKGFGSITTIYHNKI
jgi:hypothetical protein